jgi:colanic acid/amylovoran biosynthesis protein
MIRVGLLWHSISSTNLGVGALTFSQMAIIDEAAARSGLEVEYVLLGWIAPHTYDMPNKSRIVGAADASLGKVLKGKSNFIKLLNSCDIVFDIGEGDSFSDIYGVKRFSYLIATKLLAIVLNKPLVMSPQTIGPFSRPWAAKLATAVMRRCQRVFARDGMSYSVLENLHVNNRGEAIDVAFRLPYEKRATKVNERIKFGLNVSGLLYAGGYSGRNELGLNFDYAKFTHDLIERVLGELDCDLYLVSHVALAGSEGHHVDDDYSACQELHRRYPSTKLVPAFKSPLDAKSFIASMDFFSGARMHACIGAYSSGVPVVPLAYSRKFNGLFDSLAYSDYCDCKTQSAEEVIIKIVDAYHRRSELAEKVAKGNQIARNKLGSYVDYVAQKLAEIAHVKA